jgi:putative ABC transport system permease protein
MLKNILKITLKLLLKNRMVSLITVIGFSIGITAAILMSLFIKYELSYDDCFPDSERTYRVMLHSRETNSNEKLSPLCPPNLRLSLKNNLPEVESVSRLYQAWYAPEIKVDNTIFNGEKYYWADEEFFNILNINFVYGDNRTALKQPYSITLNENIAQKYFGNKNPIENTLSINGKDYKITGVFKNIPSNSHFHPNFIVSFSTLDENTQVNNQGFSYYTYLKLKNDVNLDLVNEKINKLSLEAIKIFLGGSRSEKDYSAALQSLKDIHLYSHTDYELEPNGNIANIYLLSVLVLFILIIASANFINLMISRSQERMKEIGVRKVMGAQRRELIRQFLLESVIISFISFALALILVELLIDKYAFLMNRDLQFSVFGNISLTLGLAVMAVIVGVVSGIYPAIYLSSYQPSVILKYSKTDNRKNLYLSKILLVVQFGIAIFLLSSLIIISNQMNYLKKRDLGFDKERVMVINNLTKNLKQNASEIRNELIKSNNIIDVVVSQHVPGKSMSGQSVYREDQSENEAIDIFELRGGYSYLNTYGLKLIAGRDFSDKISTDKENSVILNEAAVKALGLKNPIEQNLQLAGFHGVKIIGVVKDFNYESLYEPVKPLFIHVGLQYIFPNNISVKMQSQGISESIKIIANKMKEFDPAYQLSYYFQEDAFNDMFKSEERMQGIIGYSTFLTFFIGGMGLFALTHYSTSRRKKEISLRKILGASVGKIILLILKEYIALILLSFILSVPASYLLIKQWLNKFAYRIEIDLGVFLFTLSITVVIIVITVSYQVIRAAMTNPVEALKYE